MSDSEKEVKVYHRINRLKLKAGADLDDVPGHLDPSVIKRAQGVVQRHEDLYMDEVERVLIALETSWDAAIKGSEEEAVKESLDGLYHDANHVKDIASTFGYELMQHFGESLREFAEKIDIANKAHHTIVQAHIDVMWVVFHEKIKDHGGPTAEELKKIVVLAIEKYS